MSTPTLALRFEEPGQLLEQEPHVAHGGLFLPVPEPPPEAFSEILVRLSSPFGEDLELSATVVQIVPGSGMALAFGDAEGARLRLTALLQEARRAAAAGESCAAPREESGAEEDDKRAAGTLHDQIRAMPQRERMQLALHGGRAERRILMRDTNKTIHVFVLKNPRISLDEIRYIAGYAQANPEVLKMIGDNREWLQNPGVVSALVRNPKTPPATAVRLVDRLPMSDLRRLAKSSSVPMHVSQAAKKKVVGKQ